MALWSKHTYGTRPEGGNWTITNGHLHFDIHLTIDCSIEKTLARHSGPEHYIVSPEEANAYAEDILKLLNDSGIGLCLIT